MEVPCLPERDVSGALDRDDLTLLGVRGARFVISRVGFLTGTTVDASRAITDTFILYMLQGAASRTRSLSTTVCFGVTKALTEVATHWAWYIRAHLYLYISYSNVKWHVLAIKSQYDIVCGE